MGRLPNLLLFMASWAVPAAACTNLEERDPPDYSGTVSAGKSTGAAKGPDGAGGAGGAGVGGFGGAGGDGGEGGQVPGSNCDLSGDCGTCIQCSRLGDCVDADIECNNDPTCVDALACLDGCDLGCGGDTSCYSDCASTCQIQSAGFGLAVALISCTCKQDCLQDCALDAPFDCIQFVY